MEQAPATLPRLSLEHFQHAHCESGVTTNLLRFYGVDISEPLSFGIGAGLFFGHIPFLKVNGTPGTTFRTWPGAIFKRATQRLGIQIHSQKFSRPEQAMQALDEVLERGIPVGMQTSVYYLPYLPEAFRFHFNAHNLVVYGKEGDEYLVSDPVLETATRIHTSDLAKARFAKGAPEPKGFMYYVKQVPPQSDYPNAILAGIRQTCFMMLSPPLPWFGCNAFALLAKKIRSYPKTLSTRKAALYLGNIIRMQEEIGTGGAGFRYLFAAFLQEAAERMHREDLKKFSEELTVIGDAWRNFAYSAARIVKARTSDLVSFQQLSDQLLDIGHREKEVLKRLRKAAQK
ncbi:MAG: BtrH N-terminal domain-containing protein [Bacteroidetes bacterium]|nr:BtrH N-terminal domain-containing protein [Bacteroidota bacterium]